MYKVIEREFIDVGFVIRVLENGDTEILEELEGPCGDSESEIEIDGEYWDWNEWCDKESFERVWINDEQENGEDVTITSFENFKDALLFGKIIS